VVSLRRQSKVRIKHMKEAKPQRKKKIFKVGIESETKEAHAPLLIVQIV
jgi:hypothetical protein